MKVVFDNNVVLDAVTERHPFFEKVKKLFEYVENGKVDNYITASSMTDIFYVLRKMSSTEKAKEVMWSLIGGFDVLPVGVEDCESAMSLDMADFEDALIAVCGRRADADYIVTRDEEFLKANSPVPTISPDGLLALLDE